MRLLRLAAIAAVQISTALSMAATVAAAQTNIAHPTAVMDPAHGNWLLGEWRVADPACSAEAREVYKPGNWSRFSTDKGWKPGWSSYQVHYNVSKEYVWVTFVPSSGSTPGRVFWVDANHYKADDASGCIYERAK